jgi:gliding motility-associated-like protein
LNEWRIKDLKGFMKKYLLIYLLFFISIRGYCQCSLNVTIAQSSPSICSGYNVTLTATTSGGKAPFSYSWSTGETTQSISIDKAGTYSVSVSDNTPGCAPVSQSTTINVITTPAAPTALNQAVCENTSATLTASAPGGTYQWYSLGGAFLASGPVYITPPITAVTGYYVQTTIGGCTSPRTEVIVFLTSSPAAQGVSICAGNVATLTATGGDTYTWYDAPAAGNVLGTGNTFTTPVLAGTTTYYVSSTSNAGCVSPRTAVTVSVTPDPQAPVAANVSVCSGFAATLHASVSSGIINWYSAPAGGAPLISSPDYTTPPLTANTTYYASNLINSCESGRTPVTVTVNALPAPPSAQTVTTCYQSSVTLTASGSNALSYQWYDAPAGGNLLATGLTYTTPVLNNSTTYYVQANNGGCVSATTPINVIVNPSVPAPTAAGAIICPGTTATLSASSLGGGTYEWYDASTGGTLLSSGSSFTTPALNSNTTYYVQNTQSTCISPRTAVTVTIISSVPLPSASNTTICSGNTASIPATGAIGGYAWYDSATGGNLLSTAQVFVTPVLAATTTYYLEATLNGCNSTRVPVTVTVNATPATPVVNGATICPGTSANLTASGTTGTVNWYTSAGGTAIATGNTFTTPVLNETTTYYVESISGQCTSAQVTVTVIVNTTPQFQYSSGYFCTSAANAVPVINAQQGGTFSATPAGLDFVSTATGEINIGASIPGSYLVSFSGLGSCNVPATANITIGTTSNATFSYNGPFCQGGTDPLPIFPLTGSAGMFSASPAGLVFINTSTGEIDLSLSTPGNYTITNTISPGPTCSGNFATSSITINPMVVVSAGPNQTVLSGAPVQLAGSVSGGATTGTWSGGLGTFANNSLLNAVYTPAPGETSATLTLTSATPAGPCGPVISTVTITFSMQAPLPTVQNVMDCLGSSATLSATAPGGTYEWFDAANGGNLLSTGPNFTTPALTVNTTYYVQSTFNGITSSRVAATVTINAVPAAPVAANSTTCNGTSTTLTATGPATSYEWYDAPNGGNLLSASSTYTTPVLSNNVSYYVQALVNGCTSARTEVDVTVSQPPFVTSAATGSTCSGQPLNYLITASAANATFMWSRAAIAGISNPAAANQTSSTINETLINTGPNLVSVTYVITPMANGCSGQPFNYVVAVLPAPMVTSPATAAICNVTTANYAITFNVPNVSFSWARAAVPGISNQGVTEQSDNVIREVLFNTTNNPVNATYVINYETATCQGTPFNLVVTVNPQTAVTSPPTGQACSGVPQGYVITANVPSATFIWSRAAVTGISNPAVSNQASGVINEALVNTTSFDIAVDYIITPIANGCMGTPFKYTTIVNYKLPLAQASSNTPICVGTTLHLTAAPESNATYLWTGPNGFTSTVQNPDITNVTTANAGVYTLVFITNGCTSPPDSATVTIDPLPVANAGPNQQVCINTTTIPLNGSVTGGATTGLWSGGSGNFLPSATTLNANYIPSPADKAAGSVKLTLVSTSSDNCSPDSSSTTITFSNEIVTGSATGSACTGVPQNYVITSNTPGATFVWSRAAAPNISNPAVGNQTSGTITESLINTSAGPASVVYVITPSVNGCPGTPFNYTVTVNNSLQAPLVTSNSPVCVATTINLSTPAIPNVTYMWTGPNGFTSTLQNPGISNVTAANAGNYTLVYTNNGCNSPPASVTVAVDALPMANAGASDTLCISTTSIPLNGIVTGGTTTGLWSGGSGNFLPSATSLNARYVPSAADKAAGSVTLTLTSTSTDNCSPAVSTKTITFSTLPAVTAGPNQQVCSQTTAVALNGKITIGGGAVWSSSGTGGFTPSATQLNATYVPSAADIKNGSVVLKLTANLPGVCFIPADSLTVTFIPPPTVNAGGIYYVLKGNTITLNPTVSDPNVHYLWSPDIDINDDTLKNPTITGEVSGTYTLTITDARGCISSDTAVVKVSPVIIINNTFTPNGDGINDYWDITGLIAYHEATVDVFTRWGQTVFHSLGYPKPWDGTSNGRAVPVGVYYYVINTHFNGEVLSGWVTVIR